MGTSDDSIRENVLPAKRHFELVELIRARGQMTGERSGNPFRGIGGYRTP